MFKHFSISNMLSLAVYSDSEDDSDDDMHVDSASNRQAVEQNANTNHHDGSHGDPLSMSTDCVHSDIPSKSMTIPSSPSTDPIESDQQRIKDLLTNSRDRNCSYFESTLQSTDFVDNPKFTANALRKLNLFHDDGGGGSKTEEYSSALSLSIFNPMDHLSDDDNVDVLMKMLEQKIRENERRFQEKRERRERLKQSVRAQTEKRVPTPANGQLYRQQQRFKMGNASMSGQRNQFMANSNLRKRDKSKRKGSRWDEKR